ncbi:hypothetical protein DFP72DRAFT_986861 [Ephemerocybe angulata]|uniref:Uncharacterized protein n=1 Tax=Ephemerocybe angulata TaxID=980116 RepID=A0A8H6MBI3_9AGAR|nr:hypothetical protein DFP72DRAFT_986861 [Tulosesus angulatus]
MSLADMYLASSTPSLPGLVLQVTQLVDSYMLWVGISDGGPDDIERVASQGSLCKDWAVAMPPRPPAKEASGTSLFRPASSDVALSMAQRLARRFKKQIFLSVDMPAAIVGFGQGQMLLLDAERGIIERLKELES